MACSSQRWRTPGIEHGVQHDQHRGALHPPSEERAVLQEEKACGASGVVYLKTQTQTGIWRKICTDAIYFLVIACL